MNRIAQMQRKGMSAFYILLFGLFEIIFESKKPVKNEVKEFFLYLFDDRDKSQKANIKNNSNEKEYRDLVNTTKYFIRKSVDIFSGVPEERHMELLKLMEEFAYKAKHEPVKPLPKTPAEAKELGIQAYKEFTKTEKSKDGKECLRQNWGPWLKAFTPTLDRNYMSQADLEKCDKPLLIRLKNTYEIKELNKFLPSKPLLGKQIASTVTNEQRKKMNRTARLVERHTEPI